MNHFSASCAHRKITYYYKREKFYFITNSREVHENLMESQNKIEKFEKGKFLKWELHFLKEAKKKLGECDQKKYGFITFIAILTIILELVEE